MRERHDSRYEQSDIYPETIEQELRPVEQRQTDLFKEKYSIDGGRSMSTHALQTTQLNCGLRQKAMVFHACPIERIKLSQRMYATRRGSFINISL